MPKKTSQLRELLAPHGLDRASKLAEKIGCTKQWASYLLCGGRFGAKTAKSIAKAINLRLWQEVYERQENGR